MKFNFSSVISLVAVVCAVPTLASASISTLNPDVAADCKKLDNNHTILIVHATWCGYCKWFIPEATKVSELPQYKSWSFYEITDDDDKTVCNKTPSQGFPTSFVKNNQGQDSIILGYRDADSLEKELDTADAAPTCLIAKK